MGITKISIPCTNCGAPVGWKADDLIHHARRLSRGLHAACACDDDCAAEVPPWERERLVGALLALRMEEYDIRADNRHTVSTTLPWAVWVAAEQMADDDFPTPGAWCIDTGFVPGSAIEHAATVLPTGWLDTADQPVPVTRRTPNPVHCECGTATGEACAWTGTRSETVLVEWMPEYLRASHEAAGNSGRYPGNGAQRIRVAAGCAEGILRDNTGWAEIIC